MLRSERRSPRRYGCSRRSHEAIGGVGRDHRDGDRDALMADPVNAASRRLRAALAAVLVRDNAQELRAPRAGGRAGLRSLP